MLSKKGFTLMELLVAATIISILLVFATIQYRNSAAETRWNHAKSRLDQFANAIQRAHMDYDSIKFSGKMTHKVLGSTCLLNSWTTAADPSQLINCGYLEDDVWQDGYFEYYACEDGGSNCKTEGSAKAMACVKFAPNAKVPSAYLSYMYCAWPTFVKEYQ